MNREFVIPFIEKPSFAASSETISCNDFLLTNCGMIDCDFVASSLIGTTSISDSLAMMLCFEDKCLIHTDVEDPEIFNSTPQ